MRLLLSNKRKRMTIDFGNTIAASQNEVEKWDNRSSFYTIPFIQNSEKCKLTYMEKGLEMEVRLESTEEKD